LFLLVDAWADYHDLIVNRELWCATRVLQWHVGVAANAVPPRILCDRRHLCFSMSYNLEQSRTGYGRQKTWEEFQEFEVTLLHRS
jgi:hypothetical protein